MVGALIDHVVSDLSCLLWLAGILCLFRLYKVRCLDGASG